MSEHQHQWRRVVHMDLCHAFSSSYSCECGATRATYDERDFKDGMSRVWAMEDCQRCDELMDGALPEHSDDVMVPL